MAPVPSSIRRGVLAAIPIALVCASALVAGQQRGAPPSAPAQPGGRGGGRGGVQVMTLTSPAWPDGGQIPVKHTQAGDQVSPPFAWSNVPDGVVSFVLIAHDVDAAVGNGTDDILHWMLWNIPKGTKSLPEGIPQATQLPDDFFCNPWLSNWLKHRAGIYPLPCCVSPRNLNPPGNLHIMGIESCDV